MLSETSLRNYLKAEIGSHILELVSKDIFDLALENSLNIYSEYYPKLIDFKITRDMAFPWVDYTGKYRRYGKYKLPMIRTGMTGQSPTVWIDIENYHIIGNDVTDAYSGYGNIMLESMAMQTLSSLPRSRNYFMLSFEEPDVLVMDPIPMHHLDFTVRMKARRCLYEVHSSMDYYFKELFTAYVKWILYNRYKHSKGSQIFAGMEIDLQIDDYSSAKDDIKTIIDLFKEDYYKNPERFDTIGIFSCKG